MIKAGELILLSSGEYSDYQIKTVVKARVDFDLELLKVEYVTAFKDIQIAEKVKKYPKYNYTNGWFNPDHFINWLENTKEAVETIIHREIHLEYYGEFRVELV